MLVGMSNNPKRMLPWQLRLPASLFIHLAEKRVLAYCTVCEENIVVNMKAYGGEYEPDAGSCSQCGSFDLDEPIEEDREEDDD